MTESSHSQNISVEFILKSNGPETEPCGIPYSIFNLLLKCSFVFCAMGTIVETGQHRDKGERPYQCHFATTKERSRQSNVFDKSVKRAPKLVPVSIASLYFFIRTKRQCGVLYTLRVILNWE